MTIVEERPVITGGVDTHADLHVAAALDPIGAVTGVNENGIQLNITKQQVKDPPSGWPRSSG